MAYRSDLKKHLKTAKIEENNFSYELSYEKGENLKKLKTDEILKYVNDYYINDKDFKKEDLINDLICFKTYRDNVAQNLNTQDFAMNYISIYVAIFAIMFSSILEEPKPYNLTLVKSGRYIIGNVVKSAKTTGSDNVMSIILSVVLFLLLILFIRRAIKAYRPKKLTTLNNAIYILEAIEEDMVEVSDDKAYKLEIKRLINGKPDECIEPNIYSVKIRESLEDKSN